MILRNMQITIQISVPMDETESDVAEIIKDHLDTDRWRGEDWIIHNTSALSLGTEEWDENQ